MVGSHRRLTPLVALLMIPGTAMVGDGHPSEGDRIARVENGLLPLNIILDEPVPGMRIEHRMEFYRVPGVSIAVINKGRLAWARGYGLQAAGDDRKIDTKTLFQAASISKPVTAVAALRMVDLGKLSLDKDVNEYLSTWRVPENESTLDHKVTLRRILCHSAGMSVHGFDGYERSERIPTLLQVLDGVNPSNSRSVRVEAVPGSGFRYSGGAYSVAQLLMAEVGGKDFEHLMQDVVLRPAGMRRSTFTQPVVASRNSAAGHLADGATIPGRFHVHPELAAAGLWSTPSDLAELAVRLLRSGSEKGALLSPATVREMLKVHAGSYGLGFGIAGEGRSSFFVHQGGNAGFRAMLIAFPEAGVGAVIMTNGDRGMPLISEILRAIASAYQWPKTGWPVLEPIGKRRIAMSPGDSKRYVGSYQSEGHPIVPGSNQVATVTSEGNELSVRLAGWSAFRRAHASGSGRFFFLDDATELMFKVSTDGSTTALISSENGRQMKFIRR